MDAPAPSILTVRKVIAYIVYARRLLVFEHVDVPAAGVQVPAGTVQAGEMPATAVTREAREETGLTGLRLVRFLGAELYDARQIGRSERHLRFYYALRPNDTPPERWEHLERYASDGHVHRFALYWVPLNRVPGLAGNQGFMLSTLRTID